MQTLNACKTSERTSPRTEQHARLAMAHTGLSGRDDFSDPEVRYGHTLNRPHLKVTHEPTGALVRLSFKHNETVVGVDLDGDLRCEGVPHTEPRFQVVNTTWNLINR